LQSSEREGVLRQLGWDAELEAAFSAHAESGLIAGRIALEHTHIYRVLTAAADLLARVAGRIRHHAGSRADFPAVGDWVALEPPTHGGDARIVAILARRSRFSRRAAGDPTEEQVVAANIDTVFLVGGLDGDFNARRIERSRLVWASGTLNGNPVSASAGLAALDVLERPGTYERLEAEHGIFWPCPSEDHPGTPRLFEDGSWNPIARGNGPYYFPDGRARFVVAPHSPPTEVPDAEYPLILTTGRVVSHFLSGEQTRRIGPLLDQCPEPYIEVHPLTAQDLGLSDGDLAAAETRRGSCTLPVRVVRTIRPDTIFIPYHWPGARSANQLTISAQDPVSKIPEYKACAVRLRKIEAAAVPRRSA